MGVDLGSLVLGLCILVVAFIPAAFAFLRMFGMYLDHEISLGELSAWTFAYIAAFGITIATISSPVGLLFAFMTLALALVGPVASYLANQIGLQRMRERDIANYLQMAKERPDIPYPYMKLGDIFYASEDFSLAARYYEAYLKAMKSGRIKARLKQCERRQRLAATKARICPQCGAENPRSVTHCIECGEPQPGLWEILEQFRGQKAISLLLWLVGVTIGIGLVLAVFGVLHPVVAAGLYIIAAAGLFIYLYIRNTASEAMGGKDEMTE